MCDRADHARDLNITKGIGLAPSARCILWSDFLVKYSAFHNFKGRHISVSEVCRLCVCVSVYLCILLLSLDFYASKIHRNLFSTVVRVFGSFSRYPHSPTSGAFRWLASFRGAKAMRTGKFGE